MVVEDQSFAATSDSGYNSECMVLRVGGDYYS